MQSQRIYFQCNFLKKLLEEMSYQNKELNREWGKRDQKKKKREAKRNSGVYKI